MTTLNSLKELTVLNNKNYTGKLSKYQQEGNKLDGRKVVQYEQDRLNVYQNLLYKRAIFGLEAYTSKELKGMHRQKKKRVEKVHKKAQLSLNLMKQERVVRFTNKMFEVWFPKCNITQDLTSMKENTDPEILNTMDLKTLGITKKGIITRFMSEGILPGDFYNRKEV